ncbi:MAG: hypothetical protein J6R25_06810 [Bacteroidales bacterium]|nr:hypothetical protein [Bacteroidales bacterium]
MNRALVILISILMAFPMTGQPQKKQEERPFREKVEATKVAYFTEKLNLTPEEAQVFWPIYNKWWGERQEANKQVHKAIKDIVALEEMGDYTDPQMKKLIKEYSRALSMESEVFDIYIEEFYKILPMEKVAKIFVAEKGFREILTNMWKEKKHSGKIDEVPSEKQPPRKSGN